MELWKKILGVLIILILSILGGGCSWFFVRKGQPPVTEKGPCKVEARAVNSAIARARDFLLSRQHAEGFWLGFLENDSSATGQYILLMNYLGQVDPVRSQKAAKYLLRCRTQEGGWIGYPGGPVSLDATIINYVALAIFGISEEDQEMEKTCQLVVRLGGLEHANFFTRMLLGFYNIFPFESLPWTSTRIMESLTLIYRQGFARTIFIPYMVLYDRHAVQDFSSRVVRAVRAWGRPKKGREEALFERVFEGFERLNKQKSSAVGQEMCLEWLAAHQEQDGTWAGVFQVSLFSLMALHADGSGRWDELIRKGLEGVISYQVETRDEVIQQFSVSPVMDTAYALRALLLAGLKSDSERIRTATKWLVGKQSLREGDWKHNDPEGVPGGWSFEFQNTWYPDLDCTSMVLNALTYQDEKDREPYYPQMDRGVNWVLSMQNWDGGFAVWDKNNWLIFKVLSGLLDVGDYSDSDITARVMMSLAHLQMLDRYRTRNDLRSALHAAEWFLWRHQQSFQRWYGRWGADYTYGTGQVLEALGTIGITGSHILVCPSIKWLISIQNPDGGWGESLESYRKGRFAPAQSTIAQTSIVLQGLITVGSQEQESIDLGIAYLLAGQKPEGDWQDNAFFAVNIPKAWYGRYELIPTLSAMIALCEYRDRFLEEERSED